jgi:hypothetical protein
VPLFASGWTVCSGVATRDKHYGRRVGATGNALRDSKAVGTRQPNVEEYDRGPKGGNGLNRLDTVHCLAYHRESLGLEESLSGFAKILVVVDDEHRRGHDLIVAP